SIEHLYKRQIGVRLPDASSHGSLGHRLQRVELDRLGSALDKRLLQAMADEVEASRLCGTARYDERAVVVLGQAFEPRGGVHRVANGCDDLRARRSHRADDSLAEMNADADAQWLFQIGPKPRIELIEAR